MLLKFLMLSSKLRIHSLESFGTHDGPGVRMVLFLQGCNIKCLYCHNPDTIKLQGGEEMEINDLVERAVKMKSYFGKKGGVTVSGGEPLLQSKVLIPFFEALKKEGIHTNVDTNGTVNTQASREMIENKADLVMFDLKNTTEDKFESLTGVRGLGLLKKSIDLREQAQKPFWLRYVLVPGITDSEESLQWIIDNFSSYQYLDRLQLLPYHRLGVHKWESLGWKYELDDITEHTQEEVEVIQTKLADHFKVVTIN